tara:strand:- start:397 stop:645 length:249 start_codon:yes stop_codon:yes gene_type:complete
MNLNEFTQMCDTLKVSGKCNEKYIQKLWKKSIYRCNKQSELLIQQLLYNRYCELKISKKINLEEFHSIIIYFIECEKKKFTY